MLGQRVVFEPRAIAYDHPSTHPTQERRRKIRTLAGNYQLLRLFPAFMLPWRNPIFVQFLSHKVLRLVAPWAMVIALVSNGFLALHSAAYAVLLALQLVFYAAAVLGQMVPAFARVTPVKLASTFVLLNGFAALGLIEYLTNQNAHQWKAAAVSDKGQQAR